MRGGIEENQCMAADSRQVPIRQPMVKHVKRLSQIIQSPASLPGKWEGGHQEAIAENSI